MFEIGISKIHRHRRFESKGRKTIPGQKYNKTFITVLIADKMQFRAKSLFKKGSLYTESISNLTIYKEDKKNCKIV